MKNKICVIPFDKELIGKMKGYHLVVRTDKVDDIMPIFDTVNKNNKLHAILIDDDISSFSEIEFDPAWAEIPLIFYCFNLGQLDRLLLKVNTVKSLNLRVFLSVLDEKNYTSLKILSSLGIDCGLLLERNIEKINWDKLTDLASYQYLSPVSHASTEPFDYIYRYLNNLGKYNFSAVYFNSPEKYLHISSDEKIAFSHDDLVNGKHIGSGIDEVDAITLEYHFEKTLELWYSHFIELDECAICPAMRICNKKYQKMHFPACKDSFSEIYNYAELRSDKDKQHHNKELCQL
jgi:uncharacterized protein YozE (UPF0346 family)